MSKRIFQHVIGLLVCFHCRCGPSGPECWGTDYHFRGDCSCSKLGNLIFEPVPPSLEVMLEFVGMFGRIQIDHFIDSPKRADYIASVKLYYDVKSPELEQECIEAVKGLARDYTRKCNDFSVITVFEISLSADSKLIRLAEPQPVSDPEKIGAITLRQDDSLWTLGVSAAGIDIPGIQWIKGTPEVLSYDANAAVLRLERVAGERWRFSAEMEILPNPDLEDLLKQYNLWVQSIRFSATCECDVGPLTGSGRVCD